MTAYSLLEDYILKVKYVLLYEQVANSIPALSVKNLQVSFLTTIYAEVQSHLIVKSPSFQLTVLQTPS